MMKNIVILGAGSIGTAFGNALAVRNNLQVTLLSIEADVVTSIHQTKINQKYFPNVRLNDRLNATTDNNVLRDAELVFYALPSGILVDYINTLKPYLSPNAVIINMAKGFGCNNELISNCLQTIIPNRVYALKGPSFAREIINNSPTAFTLAGNDLQLCKSIESIFDETIVFVDISDDLTGVEILSILKNIYAIIIGIVDAHFNSPNLRFLMFTRAFNEMRKILLHFGGKEETMFKFCGIGDFGLTSLNDLSRNRTLGLLIGKGFFTEGISNKVVLEGRVSMRILLNKLSQSTLPETSYHMMLELEKVLEGNTDIGLFVNNLINERH